eukprot:SAG11_NODE_1374_length_5090_cov_8.176718_3_plen_189_part_00
MLWAAAILTGCTLVSAQSVVSVVPLPLSIELDTGGGRLALERGFTFSTCTHGGSPTLVAALSRFRAILFAAVDGHGTTSVATSAAPLRQLRGCDVQVQSEGLELSPATDESYQLKINSCGCNITAPTVFGAMHGMQTFVQLARARGGPNTGLSVPLATVVDEPRFPLRATMIDTSRYCHKHAICCSAA